MKISNIKITTLILILLLYPFFLFSDQSNVLELYQSAPVNLLEIKHRITQQGDKYVGITSGGEEGGVIYKINFQTNRMMSTQEYFRDAHLGITTSVAKQTDNKANEYLIVYFDRITGGTGVKSSEIVALKLNRGKWTKATNQVIPNIDIINYMEDGFDKSLFKKLKRASGIFIKEFTLPLDNSVFISSNLIATWLPSQVDPPLHEIISNISDKIIYSFILKWNSIKGKFEIFKKVKKDEVETFFNSLSK